MKSRECEKPYVYVVASEDEFQSAKEALPTVVKDLMEDYNFIQVTPAEHSLTEIKVETAEAANYLVIFNSEQYKYLYTQTLFRRVYPEAARKHIVTRDQAYPGYQTSSTYSDSSYSYSSTQNQTPAEIFREAFAEIRTATNEAKQKSESIENARKAFFHAHNEIKGKSWTPAVFSKTRINPNSSIEDMLSDALHKKSSDANKVAIQLKWLTEEGELTEEAPPSVRDAFNNVCSSRPSSDAPSTTIRPMYF